MATRLLAKRVTIVDVAKRSGVSPGTVSPVLNGATDERLVLRGLHQRQRDGMILVSLRPGAALLQQLREAGERLCLIGSFPADIPADAVRVDSAVGVALALAHLIDQGRSRIAMINGTEGTTPATTRALGFRAALIEHGLPVHERRIVTGDLSTTSGYWATSALLARGPDIDAIFGANDAMAIGVLRRLRELGRDVPGDIAVVGMDDISMGAMTTPTLTSVSLRAEERGAMAARLLLERRASAQPLPPRTVHVQPTLVVRESSTRHVIAGAPVSKTSTPIGARWSGRCSGGAKRSPAFTPVRWPWCTP
jgi:LacI family transcriptional regulator